MLQAVDTSDGSSDRVQQLREASFIARQQLQKDGQYLAEQTITTSSEDCVVILVKWMASDT